MTYHSLDIDEVLRIKQSGVRGLSKNEAARRLSEYGENKLKEEKHTPVYVIFLRQFNEFVIYILLFAALVSFFVKEFLDGYVILAILIFNAVLGFFQEYKAERAVQLLKQLTTLKAKVLRDGVEKEIPSSELVPGDIVVIEAGDKVPADVRIIEAKNLQSNEAALTGESLPCSKQIKALDKYVDLAERNNMLYSGTIVVRGDGKGIVVETGMNTEIGKIAAMVQEAEDHLTPLQLRLRELGKFLGWIIIGVCVLVFMIGIVRRMEFYDTLLTTISLAVAAVPEGLPAVVTICLALSVQRMIKKNALIKKLKSIETLGSVTVIASDKTGTLTKNEMTVRKIYVNGKAIDISGEGYSKEGEFLYNNKPIKTDELRLLLEIAISCNNATETVGDPTEMALLYAAKKADVDRIERKDEIPFDADKKYMATMHDGFSYYKGAPEVILGMCNYINILGRIRRITDRDKEKILAVNQEFASNALRVLAMAYKKGRDMTFVGLMGMIDPPKDGVREAISVCKAAGIRSIMITGDHPLTAAAIAKQIGFDGRIITGKEIDEASDAKMREIVKIASIYARTSSAHKVKILKALQENGEIVAMTGDGINDAPALKNADVGVAMSLKGTDVSRDAAQMVLVDDHYASIVNGVEEGRIVYDNIKKFVSYLLSANTAEIMIIFFSMISALPLPLLPLQLLWLNLMTDSWPALALSVDKPEDNVMTRKPRNPREGLLRDLKPHIIATGIVGTVAVLGMFYWYLKTGQDLNESRTVALTTLIVFELFRVFSCKSSKAFTNIFTNRWVFIAVIFSIILQLVILYSPLGVLFKVTSLGLLDWGKIIVVSAIGYFALEIFKFFTSKNGHY